MFKTKLTINYKYLHGLLFFILLLLSIVFTYPLLKQLSSSCHGDWDYFQTLHEVNLISIFKYGQFPLWNPYSLGGMPLFANPQSSFPSLAFIVCSCFGVIAGLKLAICIYTFIGLTGVWFLCKKMGINWLVRFMCLALFIFSSYWPLRLAEGHFVWLPVVYLPYLMLFYLKSFDSNRFLVLAALIESLIIFEGGTYIFAYSILFLFVYALIYSVEKRNLKPVILFAVLNLISFGLSAPKLLPMLKLLQDYPRLTDGLEKISWADVLGMFIERNAADAVVEYGAFIGFIPIILYIVALVMVEGQWALKISSIFLITLTLGNFAAWSPWNILHTLPFFSNFRGPTRTASIVCFTIALMCGLYITRWFSSKSLVIKIFTIFIVLFIASDIFIFSRNIFNNAYIPARVSFLTQNGFIEPETPVNLFNLTVTDTTTFWNPNQAAQGPFKQIKVPGIQRFKHGAWSDQLLPCIENKGVIDAYEPIPIKSHAIASTDDSYKGEYYLLSGSGNEKLIYWSPNVLKFKVTLDKTDTLVLNQNYWDGWRTSIGHIKNNAGLLSVVLPPGRYEFQIKFIPSSFVIGCIISTITLLGGILFIFSPLHLTQRLSLSKRAIFKGEFWGQDM